MNPLSLRARNYRTFETLDLDLPAGVTAVIGPNGSGKSSLVNIVDLCLFGQDGRSWAPYLTQGGESTELMLELTFEHDGRVYRVRRGYIARGKGKPTLDLEQRNPEDVQGGEVNFETGRVSAHRAAAWIPLTGSTIAETEKTLEVTLGLTRETFRASSMLVQGDGAAFTEAPAARRKEILAAVLGLERWKRRRDLVRRDTKAATAAIDTLNGALQRADADLANLPSLAERLESERTRADKAKREQEAAAKRQAEAEARAAELAGRDRERHRLLVALTEAVGELGPLEQRAAVATAAETELGIVNDELAGLTTPLQDEELRRQEAELVQIVEGYVSKIRARDAAKRELELKQAQRDTIIARKADLDRRADDARAQAAHLADHPDDAAECDRCGQTLGAEARASTIASLLAQADDLVAAAADVGVEAQAIELPEIPPEPEPPTETQIELGNVRERLAKARADETQRARLQERARSLQEKINARPTEDALKAATAARDAARAALAPVAEIDPDELQRAQGEAHVARERAETERDRHASAREQIARLEVEVARLRTLEETSAGDRAHRETLLAHVDRLAILDRAYDRDGIPALIIGNVAIPAIEVEAGRILTELGTSYRVELRTEKALASGATADALDVVVVTEAGERPYETFSGGERTRLNLALRIALARLLANRRGAESRLLAIDEPEFLDDAGTAALANVLRGLQSDFERIYLISHVPDLRDALDAAIEVTKTPDGRSMIGGPA